MIINASEYGIKPDKENGKELSVLLKSFLKLMKKKRLFLKPEIILLMPKTAIRKCFI